MAEASAKAWRCTLCGYVHRGGAPPVCCPVCGVPASEFEPAPSKLAVLSTRWRCTVCGHIHDGSEPPDACPLCGAGRGQFEPATDEAPAAVAAPSEARVVILGGGIAGLAAAERLRSVAPDARISLVSSIVSSRLTRRSWPWGMWPSISASSTATGPWPNLKVESQA